MKTTLKTLRLFFQILSVLNPWLAAKVAFRLFQTPRKKPMSEKEQVFYETTERFIICHEKEDIIAHRMGNPLGKVVFLVHGWEANAGSMAGIAFTLVQLGYQVIGFDLPAHGNSRLSRTNLIDCFKAFKAVLDYFRPRDFSVISHSFGSAVATYTLSHTDHKAEQLVFLTAPDHILDIFKAFKTTIGLGNRAYRYFLKNAQSLFEEDLHKLSVRKMAAHAEYGSLLLLHDRLDKVIPFQVSVDLYQQLPDASLEPFEKVGHYRMLWNPAVINEIIRHWQTRWLLNYRMA